jgi:hypothetical protein
MSDSKEVPNDVDGASCPINCSSINFPEIRLHVSIGRTAYATKNVRMPIVPTGSNLRFLPFEFDEDGTQIEGYVVDLTQDPVVTCYVNSRDWVFNEFESDNLSLLREHGFQVVVPGNCKT